MPGAHAADLQPGRPDRWDTCLEPIDQAAAARPAAARPVDLFFVRVGLPHPGGREGLSSITGVGGAPAYGKTGTAIALAVVKFMCPNEIRSMPAVPAGLITRPAIVFIAFKIV